MFLKNSVFIAALSVLHPMAASAWEHETQQAAGARFHMSGHMTQYAYENNSEMWIAEWLVSPEVADLRKISSADRINMPAPAPPHTFSC